MALDRKITAPFPNAVNTGSPVDHISIPLADLPGLTLTHATIATSDWPSLVLAFNLAVVKHYQALATADKPLAIVPKLTTAAAAASGSFPGSTKYTFTIDVYVPIPDPIGAEAEPA
jgi:hypothetical protein